MSVTENPHEERAGRSSRHAASGPEATATATVGLPQLLAVLRIVTGLVFVWAFLDKLFGLGYATGSERAWLNGGSPTQGYLSNINHGPFDDMFRGWAGATWADWLFMLSLAGVGFAMLLGIGLRIAAIAGTVLMLFMWVADWPFARFDNAGEPTMSSNPILDYHLLYALVMIIVAVAAAGDIWGLGRQWANLNLVRSNPWLR